MESPRKLCFCGLEHAGILIPFRSTDLEINRITFLQSCVPVRVSSVILIGGPLQAVLH